MYIFNKDVHRCNYSSFNFRRNIPLAHTRHTACNIQQRKRSYIRFLQTGSLAFAMRSTPDLPPSYASVMNVQETSAPVRTSTIDPSDENKFEDPPPYSIVIASTNMQERNAVVLNERYMPPAASTKKDDCTVASATSDLATVSHVSSHPI